MAIGAVPAFVTGWSRSRGAPALVRDRVEIADCARSGEVTTDTAVLWGRARRTGRMRVELSSNGRLLREIDGDVVDARTDHTGRVHLRGLAPGRRFEAAISFTDHAGRRGPREVVSFSTAPIHEAAQSFVWSGDTCGQGWGINPDLGGLTIYAAILHTRPDFLLHCGDTIYADEPIEARVVEPDGQVWRNLVTEEVGHVAETLADYRGRHRYPLLDDNVRSLYAEVPTIVQWDDHETLNNWFPGEQLDDDRYTERDCDVLAARGRRAWQEYQPVPVRRLVGADGDGYAAQRIYRRVPRGPHLDLFVLDMRSYRGSNAEAETGDQGILGPTQEAWLIESLAASTATWKVVSADLPLSIPSVRGSDLDGPSNGDDGLPLGRERELARVLSALKRHGVHNVVWLTADVHYTAAHHYDPDRAAYADFDPFWEFVSGPMAGGTFEVKDLDETFGPEVVFSKGNRTGQWDQSPREGNQFFGHVAIDSDAALTVTLHAGSGVALWSTTLEPAAVAPPARLS